MRNLSGKSEIFSVRIENFLHRIHDPQISKRIDAAEAVGPYSVMQSEDVDLLTHWLMLGQPLITFSVSVYVSVCLRFCLCPYACRYKSLGNDARNAKLYCIVLYETSKGVDFWGQSYVCDKSTPVEP